jgi:hypothetical protein
MELSPQELYTQFEEVQEHYRCYRDQVRSRVSYWRFGTAGRFDLAPLYAIWSGSGRGRVYRQMPSSPQNGTYYGFDESKRVCVIENHFGASEFGQGDKDEFIEYRPSQVRSALFMSPNKMVVDSYSPYSAHHERASDDEVRLQTLSIALYEKHLCKRIYYVHSGAYNVETFTYQNQLLISVDNNRYSAEGAHWGVGGNWQIEYDSIGRISTVYTNGNMRTYQRPRKGETYEKLTKEVLDLLFGVVLEVIKAENLRLPVYAMTLNYDCPGSGELSLSITLDEMHPNWQEQIDSISDYWKDYSKIDLPILDEELRERRRLLNQLHYKMFGWEIGETRMLDLFENIVSRLQAHNWIDIMPVVPSFLVYLNAPNCLD